MTPEQLIAEAISDGFDTLCATIFSAFDERLHHDVYRNLDPDGPSPELLQFRAWERSRSTELVELLRAQLQ